MTRLGSILLLGVVLGVAGCANPKGDEISDPYEARNREVHEANKALDRGLIKPVALTYGETVPSPVRKGFSNFASNLGLVGTVANDLMQANIPDALVNTTRFAFNSTFGLAGLLDPATEAGLYERPTDFGMTMARWGVPEGHYVELPVLGPSTERDTIGKVVDFAMNPVRNLAHSDLSTGNTVAAAAAAVNDRYEYNGLVEGVLYGSADSYAQSRLLYLQNRRHTLGQGADDDYVDLYDDPYAQ